MHGYDLNINFDGIINIIDIKEDENNLLLKVNKSSEGKMTITLPRNVIDAKQTDGEDAKFIVLVDGKVTNYEENKFDDYRVIAINILNNTSEVQIVGSRVVPEFSTIMIILALSITIIILNKRFFRLY